MLNKQRNSRDMAQDWWKRFCSEVIAWLRTKRLQEAPASLDLALVDGDITTPSTAAKIMKLPYPILRIDALINNAGIYFSKHFTDYTVDDLRSLVSVNIEGFLFITQLTVKRMLAQAEGSVVNITTTMAGSPIAGINPRFR